MYEGKWSCMHKKQQGSQLMTIFFLNFKENASDMLLDLRMEGRKGIEKNRKKTKPTIFQ